MPQISATVRGGGGQLEGGGRGGGAVMVESVSIPTPPRFFLGLMDQFITLQ